MSAGTLIVHQVFDVLTDLHALTRVGVSSTSTIYVDDPANLAVRIVFTNDPAAPGFASSFIIDAGVGTSPYAEGDYAVSLGAFEAALTVGGITAALAVLIQNLGTLALAPGASTDLVSLKPGLTIEGNDEGTSFVASHAATTVNAGGGDDTISYTMSFDGGQFNGGGGYDTLAFDSSAGLVDVYLLDTSILFTTAGFPPEAFAQSFTGIEFFRGSQTIDRFWTLGEGVRFEGGAGEDTFALTSGAPVLTDIVDYGGEDGGQGIVVNLGFDPLDIAGLADDLESTLMDALGAGTAPANGQVRDTFGSIDAITTGYIVEGTDAADFFFGSSSDDAFVGDGGADHFFGGDGNDGIEGGADIDTFYLNGDRDDYIVDVAHGIVTIEARDGSGIDTVTGVELFSFAGDVKTVAQLTPVVADPPAAANDDNSGDPVVEAGAGMAGDSRAQGDVLANDVDTSDPITVVGIRAGNAGGYALVGAPATIVGIYGTLTIKQDGSWNYVLDNSRAATNAIAAGTTVHDVFTYKIAAGADTDEAMLDISIAGSNDAPVFASPAASHAVNENTTVVASLSALDIDGPFLGFGLAGPDAAAFTIDGTVLRFVAAPDHEATGDSDGDNVYEVTVVASDGSLIDTRSISVIVLDAAGGTIEGTPVADRIDLFHAVGGKTATGEEDMIRGNSGKDSIAGAGGDDTLMGGKGDDWLSGDAGNDVLQGGAGKDRLDGGEGADTADYSDAGKSVVLTLKGGLYARARVGGVADDALRNIENIAGGQRADKLTGDGGANVLWGNGGNDVLAGRSGADLLVGGVGRDKFVFDTRPGGANVDLVLDFAHNVDRLALDDKVFKGIGSGLSPVEFYAAAGATSGADRNDRIIYNTATGDLYYDRDGNKPGGYAAVLFATLSGAPAIDAGDFQIV